MTNCRLIIKDEVNIKFEGLSVEIRRKIANRLKYEVPYARHMPHYKLGRCKLFRDWRYRVSKPSRYHYKNFRRS